MRGELAYLAEKEGGDASFRIIALVGIACTRTMVERREYENETVLSGFRHEFYREKVA